MGNRSAIRKKKNFKHTNNYAFVGIIVKSVINFNTIKLVFVFGVIHHQNSSLVNYFGGC